MISFNQHILECLDITSEWLIDKPGTDPDMYNRLQEFKTNKPLGEYKVKSEAQKKKRQKLGQYRTGNRGLHVESRSKLQARNQNKYKRS